MATTLAERAQSAMLTPERAESALAKDVPHVDREERVPFSLLSNPKTYKPHTFDYIPDRDEPGKPALQAWIEVFRNSRPQFHKMAMEDEDIPEAERQEKADAFLETYEAVLQGITANPTKPLPGFEPETVNCISLSAMRDRCLREQGFADCFRAVKAKETDMALTMLQPLLEELDGIQDRRARLEKVLRGVIAGNIFDLGAAHGADLFNSGKMPKFQDTRDTLQDRPWCVDDLDAALDRLTSETNPIKKAVFFCDNAGSDVVLGILPFARELTKYGTHVMIAANGVAAINDVTAEELRQWIAKAAVTDYPLSTAVKHKRLIVVSTGTDNCVIDLRQVSYALSEAAKDADFVVLEGMGRGIETNLWAEFKVAAMKVGMIKHKEVAMELGGQMFGCVCKFDDAPRTTRPSMDVVRE
eukprot:CAMPEP_0206138814 /NCGR_PEP_ID=MMETSP1473-20131121/3709_1 /ASSEMBLY_ACC=CAM_ASM_001109 /TAXON_ID=1461547 /ORGANISM="Stichococcus sp, Strain RCC1054" /LENGTH=413 /DNA_ID=CAMNT_0053532341 /DNA_START=158 /DNA_END=1399 /DNA_ORIENTATION=-